MLFEGKKHKRKIRSDFSVITLVSLVLASVINYGNCFVSNNNVIPSSQKNKIPSSMIIDQTKGIGVNHVGRSVPSSSSVSVLLSPKKQSSLLVVRTMWSRDDEEIEGSDKYKSCFPYLLPLLDGDEFGRFIYERAPPLGFMDDLLLVPLNNIPLLSFALFLILNLGTFGNTSISRPVRFNAQQACLIDILLIAPSLVESIFDGVTMPRYIVEPSCNFVYYTYMSLVIYSVYKNLNGKKPEQIPYISDLAEMLVGPM